ncbi:MAG: arylesterase [Deltaproteobacteria bacterium]|nr:arylesterase [Deltaproteobacteria bacterium]
MPVMTGCEQQQDSGRFVQAPAQTPGKDSAEANRPTKGTIVAVGDSLTAGLGVDENLAYPSLIEKRLAADGLFFKVVNAGISGETSSGTLSRINWVISSLKPDMVILVTGANDGLRGIDAKLLKQNLDQIITILKEKKIRVVLGGMKMLPNLGPDYVKEFERVYPEMADKHHIPLIPFFLKGVAGEKTLNQPDGIHPTAEGYTVIVDHIYPYILEAVLKLQS